MRNWCFPVDGSGAAQTISPRLVKPGLIHSGAMHGFIGDCSPEALVIAPPEQDEHVSPAGGHHRLAQTDCDLLEFAQLVLSGLRLIGRDPGIKSDTLRHDRSVLWIDQAASTILSLRTSDCRTFQKQMVVSTLESGCSPKGNRRGIQQGFWYTADGDEWVEF
jgi:hypothetical protein